jgi:trk system potassium uptake protein TrkH
MCAWRLKKIEVGRAAIHRIVQLVAAVPLNLYFISAHNALRGDTYHRNVYLVSGLVITALFSVVAAMAILFMSRKRRAGFFLAACAYVFILPWYFVTIPHDWYISTIAILINGGLAASIAARTGRYFDDAIAGSTAKDLPFGYWTPSVLWLNSICILVCILSAGYGEAAYFAGIVFASVIIIGTLGVSLFFELTCTPPRLRSGPYVEWILLVLVAGIAWANPNLRVSAILIALRQCIVVSRQLVRTHVADRISRYFFRRPAQLLATSFICVIITGTFLLSLPFVSATGSSISLVDALFTATSGTCVTGLIVLDTATDFSMIGQCIILFLIQIGGLGIMTISTFAAITLGRNIGLSQEYSLSSMIGEASYKHVYLLIKFICIFTFCIEAIGCLILFPQFLAAGLPLKTALWKSVFHSVSGFCNAGFSLQTNSLIPFQNYPGIMITMSTLIVIGGLGFGVLFWVWTRLLGTQRKDSFHVTVVLRTTAVLLIAMALFVFISEYHNTLASFSLTDKIANAWFYAVTPRTAGFNTIRVSAVEPATRFITIILMFIGVAPGSTGGGIKITTLMVLILTVRTLMRGGTEVQGFRHSLDNSTIFRAAAVFMLGVASCVIGLCMLLATQSLPFEQLLFESVSAFGTVGLSMGATPQLSTAGRLIITILMFVGRVGPLTLVLSMQPLRKQVIYYPRANVMVG